MKKRFLALVWTLTVFVNACGVQQVSTPEIDSKTPSSSLPLMDASSTMVMPTPLPSETVLASPTLELFDTPTFSPTLTPLSTLKPNTSIPLVYIDMKDNLNGWGISEDGHIVHTTDGTVSWKDVTPPQGAYNENGFFALDGQIAWASPHCFGYPGQGQLCNYDPNQTYVWATQDGGSTWAVSSPICLAGVCNDLIASNAGYVDLLPKSIRFSDLQHGWMLISSGSHMEQDSYNGFYSSDGGKTWKFLVSEFTNNIIFGAATALQPLDGEKAFLFFRPPFTQAVGNNLRYFQSNDGGKNWNDDYVYFAFPTNPIGDPVWDKLDCGTIESKAILPDVMDLTQQCHYVNENNQQTKYFIHLHSENGGQTWNYWEQTGDVDFVNEKLGWQLVTKDNGMHELQQTLDGGHTWTTIKTVDWDGRLNFLDEQIGWALAYQPGSPDMAVVSTNDGGKTWKVSTQATLVNPPCLITWFTCN